MTRKLLLLVTVTMLLAASEASAQVKEPNEGLVGELELVANPKMSMEPGVRSTLSLGRLLFTYKQLDPVSDDNRIAGLAWRALTLFFIDFAAMSLQATFIHEVFGHGWRGRERGLRPSYEFYLPTPYSWLFPTDEELPGGRTRGARTSNLESDVVMTVGGIEVSAEVAQLLNTRLMQRADRLSYYDGFTYTLAKLDYSRRFVARNFGDASVLESRPSWDADRYVLELRQRFNLVDDQHGDRLARQVRFAFAWSLLDPTLWTSVYHAFYTYLWRGELVGDYPVLELGKLRWYAAPGFGLSPTGPMYLLDLYVGLADDVRGPLLRLRSGLGSNYPAARWTSGVELRDVPVLSRLSVGAETDLWRQPAWQPDVRRSFDTEQVIGWNAGVRARWNVYRTLSVLGKVAYKTKGWLMGEPLDAGFYGHAGIAVDLSGD